jgi:hypothetical protein
VTFDKIQRICAIRRFDVLRLTRTRFAFGNIVDVKVEFAPFPENSSAVSCRLSPVTASAIVPLAASYEPDQERYNAMRDTVLEAVFQDRQRPGAIDPIHMLVKQSSIIDAVAMLRIRDRLDLTTASVRVDEIRNAPDSRRSSCVPCRSIVFFSERLLRVGYRRQKNPAERNSAG